MPPRSEAHFGAERECRESANHDGSPKTINHSQYTEDKTEIVLELWMRKAQREAGTFLKIALEHLHKQKENCTPVKSSITTEILSHYVEDRGLGKIPKKNKISLNPGSRSFCPEIEAPLKPETDTTFPSIST